MNARTTVTCILLVGLLSPPILAKDDRVTGTLDFSRLCPGDRTKDQVSEAFFGALLTPLLTGIVSQGLKTAGAKLSEAAQEKSVDIIHHGGYLYQWRGKGFELGFGCLIVASKGTEESGRTLAELVKGYQAVELSKTNANALDRNPLDGEAALVKKLVDMGFSDALLPGIVAVFDVEISAQKAAARLVPRFVVLDHSIREKKVDKKERTMTFEITLDSPALPKPFANLLIKFEKLAIAKPFQQKPKRPITSSWFPLPAPDKKTVDALAAFKQQQKTLASEKQTAILAGNAAVALGDPAIGGYLQQPSKCPAVDKARELWGKTHVDLETEKTQPPPNLVPRFTNAVLYYKSCYQHLVLDTHVKEAESTLSAGTGAFDVTATIKEFRKRPFAEFFGAVLSDDATRAGLTSAVVRQIDPETKAEEEKKKQEEALKLREAYEAAVVAAEIATAAYNANPQDPQKEIDMEAKKRAANRAAEAIGLPAPYPQAGSWYG